MPAINLLPPDYSIAGPVRQILKFIRPLNVILLSLFLVTVVGMGGFFVFSSISLNNLKSSNDSIKNQIKAQQSAQQQIVLLKDRVSKIKTAQAIPSATKNMENVYTFLTLLSPNSLVSELDSDPKKASTAIVFKSNSDLTNFVQGISTNKSFGSVVLSTFGYNFTSGYLVGLDFSDK